MAAGGSKLAVSAAIGGNAVVTVAKLFAFLATGSGAMLSETVHSFADTLNQVLLLVGVVRSTQVADEDFEYGYGGEQYVWALISAVGIFFLGCGVTVYHGVHSLLHPPEEFSRLDWAIGVLAFAFVVEGFVLYLAVRSVKQQARGRPFFEFLRTGADLSTVAVVLEDAAACLGVLIAAAAIGLTRATGQVWWDSAGTILIGLLLGAVATWLVTRNRQLLVGPAIPAHIRAQVLGIIERNPTVEEVVDFRTRMLDTTTFRIKADIHFDGEALARKHADRLKADWEQIHSYEDFERFAIAYGDDLIELLGDEIDAIEQAIRKEVPEAKHMDLEAE